MQKGKTVIRVLTIFLSCTLVILLCFSAVAFFLVRRELKTIDLSADEMLFLPRAGSLSTQLYVFSPSFDPDKEEKQRGYIRAEYEAVYGEENRILCEQNELPRMLRDAFVAIEDRRFYRHDGVDWLRLGKAALNYVLRFDTRFGASTITQQLVKNVSGESERTVRRKVREMLRALTLERRLSKEEILTYYLNIVPLGNRCVGVGAASRFYFGKEPADLTLAECAALAATINAPSRFDPLAHPEENRTRRSLVLRAMHEQGYIGKQEMETALNEEVRLCASLNDARVHIRSWYTETVLYDVIRDLSEKYHLSEEGARMLVYSGGLSIDTCCDPSLQEAAERYFARLRLSDGTSAGLVLLDPRDGRLLAVVGNVGEKKGNLLLNYAADVLRPPGSVLKPCALYAPLLREKRIHFATVLEDLPIGYEGGKPWPKNSPALYQGRIPIHSALARSKNTVAVRLYDMLGGQTIMDALARDYGITGLDPIADAAPAPLALGQLTHGVTLRDMTAAYTVFAGEGNYSPAVSYHAVYDREGNCILENRAVRRAVLSEEEAFIMTEMLREVVRSGTARSITLGACMPIAGKTGTSGGARDKWFIGYTPSLLCGVLLTAERSPLNEELSATDIWDAVMHRFCAEQLSGAGEIPQFRIPEGVIYLPFCADSGRLEGEGCRYDTRGTRISFGPFTEDNTPSGGCTVHVPLILDPHTARYRRASGWECRLHPERILCALDDAERILPDGVFPSDRPYDLSQIEPDFAQEAEEREEGGFWSKIFRRGK